MEDPRQSQTKKQPRAHAQAQAQAQARAQAQMQMQDDAAPLQAAAAVTVTAPASPTATHRRDNTGTRPAASTISPLRDGVQPVEPEAHNRSDRHLFAPQDYLDDTSESSDHHYDDCRGDERDCGVASSVAITMNSSQAAARGACGSRHDGSAAVPATTSAAAVPVGIFTTTAPGHGTGGAPLSVGGSGTDGTTLAGIRDTQATAEMVSEHAMLVAATVVPRS